MTFNIMSKILFKIQQKFEILWQRGGNARNIERYKCRRAHLFFLETDIKKVFYEFQYD